MLLLYSYIFSIVRKGYNKAGDNHPGIYAIGIVSILQLLTPYGFYILPARIDGKHWKSTGNEKMIVYAVILAVMLINYIYFYKIKSPAVIDTEIKNLSHNKVKTLKILTWLHVIVTIGLFVILANLP